MFWRYRYHHLRKHPYIPWKINMEHSNHPFRKENDLPNLYMIMFHVNLPGCSLSVFFVFLWEKSLPLKNGISCAVTIFFLTGRLGQKQRINQQWWPPWEARVANWIFYKHIYIYTLPEANIAPENGWLEYYFPFGMAYFQVRAVSFREGRYREPHGRRNSYMTQEATKPFLAFLLGHIVDILQTAFFGAKAQGKHLSFTIAFVLKVSYDSWIQQTNQRSQYTWILQIPKVSAIW